MNSTMFYVMVNSSTILCVSDMALFGLCPAQDEFYLVVCESCGQVIKPQALKHHIGKCLPLGITILRTAKQLIIPMPRG